MKAIELEKSYGLIMQKMKIVLVLAAVFALVTAGVSAQEQQKTAAVVVPFDSSGVPLEEVDVIYRMFLSEFVRTGKCTVADQGSFDKVKAQQDFQLSDWSNNDKVVKLGKSLNADIVVTGQAMKFRDWIMFAVQIFDVNSSEIIASFDDRVGDVDELFSGFPKMCRELTKNITNPQNLATGNYNVGDFGPGGGYVFYYSEAGFPVYPSDNSSPVICHYLECSPVELGSSVMWCPCGNGKWCNVSTTDGVGAGRLNTRHILNSTHYNASAITASNCAAYACSQNSTGTTKKGEWYLPSKTELDLIYKTLRKSGKIVGDAWHWSSSQNYNDNAWAQNFDDGAQNDQRKGNYGSVWAVRAF